MSRNEPILNVKSISNDAFKMNNLMEEMSNSYKNV